MYPTQTIELSPFENPELLAAQDIFSSPENISTFIAVSADTIPQLHEARVLARYEAEAALEKNMEFVREGEFEKAPAPIDVLGTARRVLWAECAYGKNSLEHQSVKSGLVDDCNRLYAEARSKNISEYFAPVRLDYDSANEQFLAYGQQSSMRELVAGGLSPYITEKEEKSYRINDNVEEATFEACMSLGNADNIGVVKIAQCADWAIKSYEQNPDGAHGGYVPKNKKIMVGYTSFDTQESCRYGEQMSIPGELITNEVINKIFQLLDLTSGANLSKIDVHATQVVLEREQIKDSVDFVKLLDQVASEHHGFLVYLGEQVSDEHHRDYSTIKSEAIERQVKYQQDSEGLAELLIDLERNKTDVWVAEKIVEDHVQNKLFKVAKENPHEARIIFDEKTASKYQKVIELELVGRFEEARLLEDQARAQAPPAVFCGAGSCGLESVEKSKESWVRAQTKAKPNEKVVKDTIRDCVECGAKGSVYYAYSMEVIRKCCSQCGVVEVKHTK